REDLGGVRAGRERAVGMEGDDGGRRGFDQVSVAGLRAGQRLLFALLVGDVAQRGDGAEQLPLDRERGGRNGYAALLAVPPHHLRLVVLLLALDRAVLALGHVLALGRDDEVVDRGAGEVLEGAAEQRARRSIGGE